jgi:GAF domain-containing protein
MPSVLSRPVASPPRPSARRTVALASAVAAPRLERLTRVAARALGAAAAQLVILDRDRLVVRGRAGLAAAFGARGELPPGEAVCRFVIEARASLAVDDAARHSFADEDGAGAREGLAAFAAAPLVASDGDVVGALYAADVAPRVWTDDEVTVLEATAAAIVEELDALMADR